VVGGSETGEEMAGQPIVVGTDGTATAAVAVNKAGELAAALEVPLHVVMSYKLVTSSASFAAAGGVGFDPAVVNEGSSSHAESIVARAAEGLREAGVTVTPRVCAGEPADSLITVAGEVGAQMIVVGNKGMVGARRVLGSVANRVSHHAPCCVLIVQTC
jgi:nucleotide-binding universal stress UspA family protein